MPTMFNSIDRNNLMNGVSEWKNMQPIVRHCFQMCIETIERQDEEMQVINKELMHLKQLWVNKLDVKAYNESVEEKLDYALRKQSSGVLREMKQDLATIKTELERKPSIKYVEDMLKSKIDKSETTLRLLATKSLTTTDEEFMKLSNEVLSVKRNNQLLIDIVPENLQKILANLVRDKNILRQDLDIISKTFHDNHYSKAQIDGILLQKVDHSELISYTTKTVERETFDKTTKTIEKSLGRHEKILTDLQIRLNDTSFIPYSSEIDEDLIFDFGIQQKSQQKDKKTLKSLFMDNDDNAFNLFDQEKENEKLKPFRYEAIINGMWKKMKGLTQLNMKLQKNVDDNATLMKRLIHEVEQSADITKVEMIAIIVEEQKLRIDSIIRGSIAIGPVNDEINRIESSLVEIRDCLGSIQSNKSIRMLFDDVSHSLEDLRGNVVDIQIAVGQLGIREESIEATSRQFESRLHLLEVYHEQLDEVIHTNHDLLKEPYENDSKFQNLKYLESELAGTSFSSLRTVALKVEEIAQSINSNWQRTLSLLNLSGTPFHNLQEIALTLRNLEVMTNGQGSNPANTEISTVTSGSLRYRLDQIEKSLVKCNKKMNDFSLKLDGFQQEVCIGLADWLNALPEPGEQKHEKSMHHNDRQDKNDVYFVHERRKQIQSSSLPENLNINHVESLKSTEMFKERDFVEHETDNKNNLVFESTNIKQSYFSEDEPFQLQSSPKKKSLLDLSLNDEQINYLNDLMRRKSGA